MRTGTITAIRRRTDASPAEVGWERITATRWTDQRIRTLARRTILELGTAPFTRPATIELIVYAPATPGSMTEHRVRIGRLPDRAQPDPGPKIRDPKCYRVGREHADGTRAATQELAETLRTWIQPQPTPQQRSTQR